MANSMLARQERAAGPSAAACERVVVQRPFRTPDQRGGAITMWANLAGVWGIVDLEPPKQVWPCQTGKDVAIWVASDYRAGVEPGFRVLLRGEVFTIDEVVCRSEQRPGLWLRVVRHEAGEGRAAESH